jgi:DNA-binding NarL/FixJ family response regulator
MKRSAPRTGALGPAPRGLVARTYKAPDGREYAVLWFSRSKVSGAPALTSAEQEVLTLLGAGLSNAAIAKARRVSVSTAATQVRRILSKLGVSSRAEFVGRF